MLLCKWIIGIGPMYKFIQLGTGPDQSFVNHGTGSEHQRHGKQIPGSNRGSGQSILLDIMVINKLRSMRNKVKKVLDIRMESGQSSPSEVPHNQPVHNAETEQGCEDFY